jgi:hypothetical protein
MRAQAGSRQWLMIIGLGLTLLGASFGFYGVWVDKDQAIEIGEARLSYDTREQDIQLPSVQNLLRQSHLAMIGFAFIGAGTLLQGIAVVLTARRTVEPDPPNAPSRPLQ